LIENDLNFQYPCRQILKDQGKTHRRKTRRGLTNENGVNSNSRKRGKRQILLGKMKKISFFVRDLLDLLDMLDLRMAIFHFFHR
jgi:hypothetical protein